jgi:hypothetical protein
MAIDDNHVTIRAEQRTWNLFILSLEFYVFAVFYGRKVFNSEPDDAVGVRLSLFGCAGDATELKP